jgi:hypothetical protein
MEYVNKQDYKLGFVQENIEMVIYSVVCFFAPFMIGHPQIVVGVLVNAALVMAGLNLRNYKLLPVIIMPSLGVLTRGLIFGPLTIFLVYMIPFIWIGNSVLVYAFKRLKMNKVMTLIIGSIVKAAFLFSAAFILVKLNVLPALFLTTMGMFQFYTALLGGALAFGVHYSKKKILA